jgi:MFS transporter, ACS family, tartrate transporter
VETRGILLNTTVRDQESAIFARIAWRIIPLLFLGYITAFLDRVNVGFAQLQMARDLAFGDVVYGFGAGIFFIGYFIFEVPSNLILAKVGARVWIARIMISWGVISSLFMFIGAVHWGPVAAAFNCTDAEFTFYLLRFLLGVAEAGFFPGIILFLTYWFPASRRAQMIALFMTAIALSNVIGSPISGAILQFLDGANGLHGWQWLFLIEGLPSVIMGGVFLALLPDKPQSAKWLSIEERDVIRQRLDEDEAGKSQAGQRHSIVHAFSDVRVWALAVVYLCGGTCLYAINFWMPTIIQEFGIDKGDYLRVGLLSMIPWGIAVIAQVLWARNSDRTGERRWHPTIGLLAAMVGLLMLAFAGHQPTISLVALSLVAAGTMCWVVTFWSLPTAFLSGSAAAAGIAWINSVGNLGGYFGPDMIGRIRAATGGDSTAAFLVLAGAALVGAAIILALPAAARRSVATQE